ncbi:hypothetical protein MMC30_005835 [Trapelia coarctata]|nr:hypothetical protein [Trapelia coarctata]
MDSAGLVALIEKLGDDLDDLEDVLLPLMRDPLVETAGKLPLLDRAKLYVLTTYAVESILFSFVRLNGVNAKEHPVYRELTRVKQYFDKIKDHEFPAQKTLELDKPAAARIVNHALSGNAYTQLERVRSQQQGTAKTGTHTRFDEPSKKRKAEDT